MQNENKRLRSQHLQEGFLRYPLPTAIQDCALRRIGFPHSPFPLASFGEPLLRRGTASPTSIEVCTGVWINHCRFKASSEGRGKYSCRDCRSDHPAGARALLLFHPSAHTNFGLLISYQSQRTDQGYLQESCALWLDQGRSGTAVPAGPRHSVSFFPDRVRVASRFPR
jgi:hypothetical protein